MWKLVLCHIGYLFVSECVIVYNWFNDIAASFVALQSTICSSVKTALTKQ